MKIIKLTAENFMKLVAVEISPEGNAILITGKNAAGKSSVFEAIKALFMGKKYHPDKPIREGADHAEIIGETESFIIKRTFTAKGGGQITVSNAEGMKASSPQALLAKLYGEIAFEPMGFYRDCKEVKRQREQRETLMKLTGLDFTDIDKEIAAVKVERSAVKTSKETYDFEAKQIPEFSNRSTELISMVELTEKLTVATQRNEKHTQESMKIDALKGENLRAAESLADNAQLIGDLKIKLDEAEARQKAGKRLFEDIQAKQEALVIALEPLIDITTINQEIERADRENECIRKTYQRTELLKKSAEKSKEFADLRKKSQDLEAKKAERLAKAKMPIEKLSVNEDTILYDNIPLAQVNDSMQLQIAVAISMALNPKLKVILMKGNDLDEASLKAVCKMAEEKDYQVWIEKVSDDKKNKTGFIIEDGSVVAADKDTLFTDKQNAQG